MKERFVFEAILGSVPQWYEADQGSRELSIGEHRWHIGSHRNLTPQLYELFSFCQEKSEHWVNSLPPILSTLAKKQITQEIALFWLQKRNSFVDWYKFISYSEEMLFRTYENAPVNKNLIISPESTGSHDITSQSIQKLLDPLASGLQTYLRVDSLARLVEYSEITWSQVSDTSDYKFNPEFLQPYACQIGRGEFSFHVTTKGDIVIMDSYGLLASYRKGQWHIYDMNTLKNSITDITNNYRVGCNVFEILLDLSYRRHGALLIFDPGHQVINHVVNQSAVLGLETNFDAVRNMLSDSVVSISMGTASMAERKKRIMLELASMDGAVIFDASNLLAFGAMIDTHGSAGNHAGARTTAFESSFLYGGKPFKVSSDGDISVRFGPGKKILSFL